MSFDCHADRANRREGRVEACETHCADRAPRAGYDIPSSETHIERLLVSCKAGFVAARTSFHSTVGALPVPFLCVDRVRAYLHEKHRG